MPIPAPSRFERYVRSGRLQKAFNEGVRLAAEDARRLGLRRPAEARASSALGTADPLRNQPRD